MRRKNTLRYGLLLGVALAAVLLLLGLNAANLFFVQSQTTTSSEQASSTQSTSFTQSSSLTGSASSTHSTSFLQSTSSTQSQSPAKLLNLTQFVNPLIGTATRINIGGGDTFPGAAYPLGMVQWSPDTVSNPPGGYSYNDSTIKDLSLTHFSGRGCQVYQDFPFMPYVGNISSSPATSGSQYYSSFSHNSEIARPGHYQVHLNSPNVTATLSVTPHTGVGQFVYPASSASTMIINAGGSINGDSNSGVAIVPATDEVTGSAESVVGCGSNPYLLFFAAKFDRPFAGYGTWNEGAVSHGSNFSSGQHTGAFVVFNTASNPIVRVQVAISFVSVANAQMNLASESSSFDLASVAKNADAAWNVVLNSIQVGGGTHDETVSFYTALYHAFFHPNIFSDVNGQYLGFDGKVHTTPAGHAQYENIPGWDSYRTQIRLLAIIAPSTASDVAQSLVNDAMQSGGSLPRWEQANADSHGMSGDDGDAIIAEAYTFGATNFDTSAALQAMIGGQSQIREGYADYAKLGYVPADLQSGLASASITLEYANDDFAIAQFANALGNSTDYNTYLQRSGNWQNLFNTASGYVQPRNADGTWAQGFDPASQNGFQEGSSAQYCWMATFNLGGLFSKMGGNAAVVTRLDKFFSKLNDGPNSLFAWMGNEPSVEVPWEYDFAQAPSHTQNVVRQIETQLWTNTPSGIPGNDDGGEMSSWYVFAAMGVYPEITAVGGFVIGSPLFTSATLDLSGGHTLQINAPAASDGQPYVQSLKLNGNPTTSLWLPWSTVRNGATLDFTLGGNPSSWGGSPQDAPPSYAAAA
ncbi:MAG: GH92 family glycosyl hydrolase [Thaumarchaeota archaeon]|nr:GH92 family glycosyl hydrolase [Nitrososphaerota archaeon]